MASSQNPLLSQKKPYYSKQIEPVKEPASPSNKMAARKYGGNRGTLHSLLLGIQKQPPLLTIDKISEEQESLVMTPKSEAAVLGDGGSGLAKLGMSRQLEASSPAFKKQPTTSVSSP